MGARMRVFGVVVLIAHAAILLTGNIVQAPASGAGPGQADICFGNGREIGKMAGGGVVRPPAK